MSNPVTDLTRDPRTYDWQDVPFPAVEDVPYDCCILLVSPSYFGTVHPWGDRLNPLRWCDATVHPRWGEHRPTGWWCWLERGKASRPLWVKTWAESWGKEDHE